MLSQAISAVTAQAAHGFFQDCSYKLLASCSPPSASRCSQSSCRSTYSTSPCSAPSMASDGTIRDQFERIPLQRCCIVRYLMRKGPALTPGLWTIMWWGSRRSASPVLRAGTASARSTASPRTKNLRMLLNASLLLDLVSGLHVVVTVEKTLRLALEVHSRSPLSFMPCSGSRQCLYGVFANRGLMSILRFRTSTRPSRWNSLITFETASRVKKIMLAIS